MKIWYRQKQQNLSLAKIHLIAGVLYQLFSTMIPLPTICNQAVIEGLYNAGSVNGIALDENCHLTEESLWGFPASLHQQ